MSLTSGTRLGPYEVLRSLGAGGMGEVYRARDTKLGRDVALKILPDTFANDPERLARFEREAKTLAALNHPHIAQIYGFEQSGTTSALVMELVEGEDLSQRIARGAMPLEEAVPIARQIAEALEAAHEQGIIHRDLKPANIKLRADGTVKVLDFGLAKAIDPGLGAPGSGNLANSPTITSPAMTVRGTILGTAAYMAPEQAKGKPLDKRADVWAFGVVLFEMLTGHRLFAGDDPTEVIAAVIRQDIEWRALPDTTPPSLRRLLTRCLERDPRRRLRDIGDAQPDLAEALTPGAARSSSPHSGARGRWLTIAAVVATIAAISLAVPAIRHAREESRAPDPATRFVIDGPPSATRVLAPEISPDGRTLVFAGLVEGSPAPALWLRPFGEAAAQKLPGTEGVTSSPFWSPDSRSLVFPAIAGELKRIDLDSRSIRTVAVLPQLNLEALSTFGGSWAEDGTILFSLGGRLYQVPATGGNLAVVEIAGLQGDGQRRYPMFLPGLRRFVFLLETPDIQSAGLYLGSLDGTEPAQRLTLADSQAVFVATSPGRGQLLFMRDGTLMAQGFDLSALSLAGEPRPIAEGVVVSVGILQLIPRAHFSASADMVVYSSATQAPVQHLTWVDRSGTAAGTVGEPDLYSGPRLSPDNRHVAVTRLDARTRNGDIYVFDLERRQWSRLTFDPADDVFPIWSPDGRYIAYRSNRNGKIQLIRKLSNGAGQEEVLYESDNRRLFADDWTADGKSLVLSQIDLKTNSDLWILPLEGSRTLAPLVQTPGDDLRARLSPDGRLLGYISSQSGRMETYVQPFPSLDGKWQLSESGGNSPPQWRRDGKELYYSSSGSLWAKAVVSQDPFVLGPAQRLFTEPPTQRGSFPAVSSDGKRFLYSVDLVQLAAPKFNVIVNWAGDARQP